MNLFGSQDFGFEIAAHLQLVFDEIVQPVTNRLFLIKAKAVTAPRCVTRTPKRWRAKSSQLTSVMIQVT